MSGNKDSYYLPEPSHWPIVGSLALMLMASGFVMQMNKISMGGTILLIGTGVLLFMMFGWFGQVIRESETGMYNKQVDKSFRLAMSWLRSFNLGGKLGWCLLGLRMSLGLMPMSLSACSRAWV